MSTRSTSLIASLLGLALVVGCETAGPAPTSVPPANVRALFGTVREIQAGVHEAKNGGAP